MRKTIIDGKITFSKKCHRCNRITRIEKAIQWVDKPKATYKHYYCSRCFATYQSGLRKMSRNPEDSIRILKDAEIRSSIMESSSDWCTPESQRLDNEYENNI